MNALGKTMVVGHAVDMQVFNGHDAVVIDDLAACLVGEVVPPERYAFMHAGNDFAMLPTLGRALYELAVLALHVCQRFFFFAEKAGVLKRCAIRKGRKGLESNINTDLLWLFRKALGFTLH